MLKFATNLTFTDVETFQMLSAANADGVPIDQWIRKKLFAGVSMGVVASTTVQTKEPPKVTRVRAAAPDIAKSEIQPVSPPWAKRTETAPKKAAATVKKVAAKQGPGNQIGGRKADPAKGPIGITEIFAAAEIIAKGRAEVLSRNSFRSNDYCRAMSKLYADNGMSAWKSSVKSKLLRISEDLERIRDWAESLTGDSVLAPDIGPWGVLSQWEQSLAAKPSEPVSVAAAVTPQSELRKTPKPTEIADALARVGMGPVWRHNHFEVGQIVSTSPDQEPIAAAAQND